ncbi:MAG: hypothetical protein VB017_04235 [Endomicrobiaceae bacterium]|jgi:F0F1-type ATP synthase delta subunit|nr:hypothetical protein [Endomicrobiaceae bacterium]
MKKQQIKQFAQAIVSEGEISENVSKWLLNNLTKAEMKLFVKYLSAEIKEFTVIAKYAGEPSDEVKNKIRQMFRDKNIVYIRDDKEIGAGIKLEFGDYILDYTVSAMIVKIMKGIKERL